MAWLKRQYHENGESSRHDSKGGRRRQHQRWQHQRISVAHRHGSSVENRSLKKR
jgi:hypothetical protein